MKFKEKLCHLENGRFEDLINSLDVKDVCEKCSYYSLDGENYYRCYVSGSCIVATLNTSLIEYFRWQLKELDD